MKLLLMLSLVVCLPLLVLAEKNPQNKPQKPRKLFPYNYTIDDLPNGLRLVTVPTDYPNLVALYIVVQTGSRNEVEAGKTGFAHFFEHMMFRGSENYSSEQRDAILKRAGADANAHTSDDRTVYHETFAKEDLEEIMKMEADRFMRLKYTLPQFQTEALAVKGEYDKNSANPFSKLYEVLRETAFKTHTYSHTTMGYIKDIQDMPNQFDYSQEFFKRFYRPEYTTIVLVGDVTRVEGPVEGQVPGPRRGSAMMAWIWWLIIGLVVGLVARFLLPGKDPMGIIATMILGVAGSLLGGLISWAIWGTGKGGFEPAGLLLSIVGAIVLLLIWRRVGTSSTV